MGYDLDEIRLSERTVDLLGRIEESAYQHVLDKAIEHAQSESRNTITEEDVLAGLRTALNEAAEEQMQNADRNATSALAL